MITDKIKTVYKFHNIEDITSNRDIIDRLCNDNENSINIYWLGRRSYNPIWELQKEAHSLRIKQRINDIVFLLEHDHVYTLGKNANENHILPSKPKDAEIIKIDRGGDVTYHGPGQLVGYPILDLHNYKMSISWYLKLLSNSIIDMLENLNIESHYRDNYVGVWVDDDKIAAFGVRLSKWITMHGFALNINTDLKYYNGMIPCGIFECGVTSISRHTNIQIDTKDVARMYSKYFIKHLDKEIN
tara:strand:- start:648 stop:1376 length:729 start_codon:yes stop_codon:yes gene_type:complete